MRLTNILSVVLGTEGISVVVDELVPLYLVKFLADVLEVRVLSGGH